MGKIKKLRMGMIGGGKGAFIGSIHRMAANLDGYITLCCGAFNSNPQDSYDFGESLSLPKERVYGSFEEMIQKESTLPENEKIHFVSIVTPNHSHFAPAMLALENGFHVVIEKPMTFTLDEAKQLEKKVEKTGLMLCLTHTYAGYPMVKQAKSMVENGTLGKVRKIWVEYPQGWLSLPSEKEGNAQAAWRTDPSKSGKAGAMGDIGTHAAHLAEYISGLKIEKLCADINTVVAGRQLDDDGAVLLKFNNEASGTLMATQVAAGEENALKIRISGELGSLEWRQQEPNSLLVKWLDAPTQIYRAANAYLSDLAKHNCRTPGGHPEGYIEAFANIYHNFSLSLLAKLNGEDPTTEMLDYPRIEEGVRGMAFIENVIESGKSTQKWTDFKI